MKYKSLLSSFLLATALLSTSCKDDFADINTDPSTISGPQIAFLLTQAEIEFEPSDYAFWFYNGKYTSRFVQCFIPTGGLTDGFNLMGETGDQGEQAVKVLAYAREIDHYLGTMDKKDALRYAQMRAMLDPLLVYLGLFDTDLKGDMPFTEAALGKYTNPMLLTPKYDRVSDLYTLWLGSLDAAIDVFTKPVTLEGETITQMAPGAQDIIYQGNVAKWAKLSNSLKLKIATRLLHKDKAKALKIAEEVANSSAGVLTGNDDNFVFNKGNRVGDDGSQNYHTGNNLNWGAANKDVIDFLVKNKDPRVRFFVIKNKFNSKIVQAFFDENKDLPAYILANVNYDIVDGTKVFRSWKGDGEPWVRYYGLPTELGAASQAGTYGDYFEANRWKIGPSTGEKTFEPYSIFNEELVRGRVDYTIPTAPGDAVIEDKVDMPWYGMYMTSAEVNLYFAEFKLLGANLPETAQTYYNRAVENSVKEYDHIASLNKVPYYGTTYGYDPNEVVIDLAAGEIEALMAKPDYQLTGSTAEQLEKIYIQQYLHFTYLPTDQFVSVRRSGVPKVGSSLIAWKNLTPNTSIPRRLEIGLPAKTDLMYQNKTQSLLDQGLTGGTSLPPATLNSERLWQDQGAPNFGEGPNL